MTKRQEELLDYVVLHPGVRTMIAIREARSSRRVIFNLLCQRRLIRVKGRLFCPRAKFTIIEIVRLFPEYLRQRRLHRRPTSSG